MDKKLYKKLLTLVPLFKALGPDELEEIVKISKLLKVRRGVTVVEEDDEGAAMYILVEGKAKVVKKLPGGDITQLAEIEAPSIFGDMSLIDSFPRSASVVTLTDTILFQIHLDSFNKLRKSYHPAAYKVLREILPTMALRLREINERIGEFFKNPQANLAELEEQFMTRELGQGKTTPRR
jgi:CRP/FNR family transcriptional regulator, cyclic AMP receptor protein